MKNLIITIVITFTILNIPHLGFAQENNPWRIGFQLNQLQGDFGLGIQLDVPLPQNWPILRLSASNYWIEIPGETKSRTESYQTINFGVANRGWEISEKVKVYADGGITLLVPNNSLAEQTVVPGAFGLFGFEFFTSEVGHSSLFLEIGGNTAGSRLNLQDGIPRFGAGMLISAGFRVAIGK